MEHERIKWLSMLALLQPPLAYQASALLNELIDNKLVQETRFERANLIKRFVLQTNVTRHLHRSWIVNYPKMERRVGYAPT